MFLLLRLITKVFLFILIFAIALVLLKQNSLSIRDFVTMQDTLYTKEIMHDVISDFIEIVKDNSLFLFCKNVLHIEDIVAIIMLRLYTVFKVQLYDLVYIFIISLVFFTYLHKKLLRLNVSLMLVQARYNLLFKLLFILSFTLLVQTYICNDIFFVINLIAITSLLGAKIALVYF